MPLSLDTVERAHVLFDAFQEQGQISLQHLNSLFHHEAFEASDVRSEYIAILKPACQSGDGATLAVWLSFFEALEDKGTLLTESLFHLEAMKEDMDRWMSGGNPSGGNPAGPRRTDWETLQAGSDSQKLCAW